MSRGAYRLKDRTAVVTGAASGIGRALAVALAMRGCHLALVDIQVEDLDETAAQVEGLGVRVSQHPLDISSAMEVAALPAAVVAAHGAVDVVINNAGVALAGRFDQIRQEDFDWLLSINLGGLVHMTRAFLPLLREVDEGRLVNVSSLFGLIAPPGQTAYATSKFAVNGFSQALANELAGTSVDVSIVYPGGVATSIAKHARGQDGLSEAQAADRRERLKRLLKMPPERAAQIILDGIVARRRRILVGNDAKIAALVARLAPVGYWRLLQRGA